MAEIKPIPEIIEEISPYYADRVKKKAKGTIDSVPETEHTLTYESYAETLEPIYYFVLDLMSDFGLKPEKLIDNFSPSPGSSQFGEMGTKASVMQQHAHRIMGDVNMVLKSVINIIYDLKDFQIRLRMYDDLKGDKKDTAVLALKQLWLDKVDMSKGNSSIKGLAVQGGFPLLIDAFLAAKDVHDATKLDIGDRPKRILIPRIQEFNLWIVESEKALRKRYQLQKTYLKSQANSLKLYSRWAKPYLISAQKLEQKMTKNAALVNAFNRTILELTLLGKSPLKVKESAIEGKLPKDFKNEKFLRKLKKGYNSCVLVDFVFRAVPQQASYIGKVDVTFRGYALNDDEIEKLKQEMDKSDMGDVLRLIEGTTDESIAELQEDINEFLEEKDEEFEIEKDKKEKDTNPFLALLGFYGKKPEKPKNKLKPEKIDIIVDKDNWIEKTHLRTLAAENAKNTTFNLFDIYKKAHGMPSYT